MPSEHDEQVAVFQWARVFEGVHPELHFLFAIPNGAKLPYRKDKAGHRYSREATRLIKEGLKPGVPDMCLPCARKGYHGLYIELKVGSNKPTKYQIEWGEWLVKEGYFHVVCYGYDAVIDTLKYYLDIEV